MHPSLTHKAVSTWSLHRTLGNFAAPGSAIGSGTMAGPPALESGLTLLELIPDLAAHGYTMLQICHFHLAPSEPGYLAEVRGALDKAGIVLDMLLIDDGDLTAPNTELQLAWYNHWLNAAAQLGAHRARLSVGRSQPTPEGLRTSGMHLSALASAHPDVRIVTENWMEMTPDAATLLAALDAAGDNVGLLIDLGNWDAPEKYEELAKIAGRAEACHAKCAFDENGPDKADYRRCLTILQDAGFTGPIVLIYDGPDDDEWAGLETEWRIINEVFTS